MTTDELVKHMSPELFVPSLAATKKDEVLQELTGAIVEGSAVNDSAVVLEMLRNREALGSTGLEAGVAFPHGRTLAVGRLTILFARSTKGVDFDSEDGGKTHLFFVLLAPPQDHGNLYLQALGRIAELVRQDDVRAQLMEVDDFDALVKVLKQEAA